MFSHTPGLHAKKLKIEVHPLLGNEHWLSIVNNWSSENSTGLIALSENDKDFVELNKKNYYILVFGQGKLAQPVGMFALFDTPLDPTIIAALQTHKPPTIKELNCVYISKNFRGLGLGSTLIKEAKKTAAALDADMIVLETLNPHLNHFYEKNGATVVCESRYPKDSKESNPTSVLMINLK